MSLTRLTWTPANFVNEGQFCDSSDFRQPLELLTKLTESDACFLLPVLNGWAHPSAIQLFSNNFLGEEWLRQNFLTMGNKSFAKLHSGSQASQNRSWRISMGDAFPTVSSLTTPWLNDTPLDIMRPAVISGVQCNWFDLFLGFVRSASIQSVFSDDEFIGLCGKLVLTSCAHPSCHLHRIRFGTQRVVSEWPIISSVASENLSYSEGNSTIETDVFSAAVENIKKVLGADSCGYYKFVDGQSHRPAHHSGRRLELVRQLGMVNFQDQITISKRNSKRSLAVSAFCREHIMLAGTRKFGVGSFDFEKENYHDKQHLITEMIAIPTFEHFPRDSSMSRVPSGVMVAAKMEGGNGGFFSAWSIESVNSALGHLAHKKRSIYDHKGTSLITSVLRTNGDLEYSDTPAAPSANEAGIEFPAELENFPKSLARLLIDACQIGGASLCVVRLISHCGRRLKCIFSTGSESYKVLPVISTNPTASITGLVVSRGTVISIENLQDKVLLKRHFPKGSRFGGAEREIKSVVCAPLVMDERLVGTVCFGDKNSFRLQPNLAFFLAISAFVNNLFSNVRRLKEQEIYDFASSIILNTHSLSSIEDSADKCRTLVNEAVESPERLNAVRNEIDKIRKALKIIRYQLSQRRGRVDRRLLESGNEPLSMLINRLKAIVSAREISRASFSVRNFVKQDLSITLDVSRASERAFFEVCNNFSKYKPGENVLVSFRKFSRGGRNYIRVQFRCSQKPRMDPRIVTLLFRTPIPGQYRSRGKHARDGLGCYIAGTVMRHVGGEAGVLCNDNVRLTLFVDLPCEEFS